MDNKKGSEMTMNDTYNKYTVWDEYSKATHTVIAHRFYVNDDGTVVFTVTKEPLVDAVCAIAPGYWSRVEFVETVEAVG